MPTEVWGQPCLAEQLRRDVPNIAGACSPGEKSSSEDSTKAANHSGVSDGCGSDSGIAGSIRWLSTMPSATSTSFRPVCLE